MSRNNLQRGGSKCTLVCPGPTENKIKVQGWIRGSAAQVTEIAENEDEGRRTQRCPRM